MKFKEMVDKLEAVVGEMRALNAKAMDECRALNAEEQEAFARMEAEAMTLETGLQRHQALAAREDVVSKARARAQESSASVGTRGLLGGEGGGTGEPGGVHGAAETRVLPRIARAISDRRATVEYGDAALAYLTRGAGGLNDEQRSQLIVSSSEVGDMIAVSSRMLSGIIQSADGNYPLRAYCNQIMIAYEESLGQLRLVDDMPDLQWGGSELQTADISTNVSFGKRVFKWRPIQRFIVKVSKRLLESSSVNIEQYISDRVGVKYGKLTGTAIMTGDGSAQQPLGLFVVSADGVPATCDVSTGSATDLTSNGLIEAQMALKTAYQKNARWLFSRQALAKIMLLTTANKEPLWQKGLSEGMPPMILGKPYVMDDAVPSTFTTKLYVGMYGDFSYYTLADGASMSVQRLVEKYADQGQIGLLYDNMGAEGQPVLAEAFVRLKTA